MIGVLMLDIYYDHDECFMQPNFENEACYALL